MSSAARYFSGREAAQTIDRRAGSAICVLTDASHAGLCGNDWHAWNRPRAKCPTAMQFGFLLDPERRLLSIGYRATDGTLDPSCYDLLASEARLASFVAIAKNDVPARHWFRLGRRRYAGRRTAQR